MSKPDLTDYVEVAERIAAFYESYPDGSFQGSWDIETIGDRTFVVYQARAYRTPDDRRPAHGTAWEAFPGRTSFTRDSELMNAETSAIGRAIAALGFEVKRGMASMEEVRNRQSNGDASNSEQRASQPQPAYQLDPERVTSIKTKFRQRGLNIGEVSVLLGAAGIDGLRAHSKKAIQERLVSLSDEQATALEGLLVEA